MLETYLLSGKDVNAKMGDGDPLLFHVVKKADIEALRQLLDRGVDVNQKGQNDVTSAMVAAVEGCSDKVCYHNHSCLTFGKHATCFVRSYVPT